jgi:hypothetical protein
MRSVPVYFYRGGLYRISSFLQRWYFLEMFYHFFSFSYFHPRVRLFPRIKVLRCPTNLNCFYVRYRVPLPSSHHIRSILLFPDVKSEAHMINIPESPQSLTIPHPQSCILRVTTSLYHTTPYLKHCHIDKQLKLHIQSPGLSPTTDEDPPKRPISQSQNDSRFDDGLFPFHSPLLRESQLFSFPPLINMLKFGG